MYIIHVGVGAIYSIIARADDVISMNNIIGCLHAVLPIRRNLIRKFLDALKYQ